MHWHARIEKNSLVLTILVLITVAIGGIVEIVPTFTIQSTVEPVKGVRPYSPLELAGRNIYIREGCYVCHSQQIRTFRDEVERYGHYSLAAESMYDHPFQWGSKRTGPDLARVGGKYSNDWHVAHLKNPREVVPESIMPPYAFLSENTLDMDAAAHLETNVDVGVPYTDKQIAVAQADLRTQQNPDADHAGLKERYPKVEIANFDGNPDRVTEMDALVAYLQILGRMVDFSDTSTEQLLQ
jgi:cytochrome c oxidase cbb3-type subunit 2